MKKSLCFFLILVGILASSPSSYAQSIGVRFTQDVIELILKRPTFHGREFVMKADLEKGWSHEVDSAIKALMFKDATPNSYAGVEEYVVKQVRETLSTPKNTLRFIEETGMAERLQSHTTWRTYLMRAEQEHLNFLLVQNARQALWKGYEDVMCHPSTPENLRRYYLSRVSEVIERLINHPASTRPSIQDSGIKNKILAIQALLDPNVIAKNKITRESVAALIEETTNVILRKKNQFEFLASKDGITDPHVIIYLKDVESLADLLYHYRFSLELVSGHVLRDMEEDVLISHILFGDSVLRRLALSNLAERYQTGQLAISRTHMQMILSHPNIEFRRVALDELKKVVNPDEANALLLDHSLWRSTQFPVGTQAFDEEVQVMTNMLGLRRLSETSPKPSVIIAMSALAKVEPTHYEREIVGAVRTLGRVGTDQAWNTLRDLLVQINPIHLRIWKAIIEELSNFPMKGDEFAKLVRGYVLHVKEFTAMSDEYKIVLLRAIEPQALDPDVAAAIGPLVHSLNPEVKALSALVLSRENPEMLKVVKEIFPSLGEQAAEPTRKLILRKLSLRELTEFSQTVQHAEQKAELLLEFFIQRENNAVATELVGLFDELPFVTQRQITVSLMGRAHDKNVLCDLFKKVVSSDKNGTSSLLESVCLENQFERGMALIKDDPELLTWIQDQPEARKLALYIASF